MPHRVTRPGAALTVAVFALGLVLPLLAWAWNGIPAPGRLPEERLAHPLPRAPRDLAELSGFPRAIEDWFGDALGGREILLRARSRETIGLLGVSPTPIAYVGQDAWVFLTDGRELDVARGVAPFGRFELETWVAAIRARQAYCRSLGAEYLFALAPDKTSIYPERHAHDVAALGPTRTDQLAAAFQGDPVFLDLRPVLRAEKDRDRPGDHAYFPHGTHWTDRGAAAAAASIGRFARRSPQGARWPELAPEDLVFADEGVVGDNWGARLYYPPMRATLERSVASIRGPQAVLDTSRGSGDGYTVAWESDDASLPKVAMFHDSFGSAVLKFVARSSARGLAHWDLFRPEVVAAEKPDLVLELFVERVLARPPVENLPAQAELAERMFAESEPTVFTWNAARDVRELERMGGVEARVEGGLAVVSWRSPTAVAALPRAVLPDGAHAVLRVELELAEAAAVHFHYRTTEAPAYGRANSISKAGVAGRNEWFLHVAAPNVRGPIVFRTNPAVGVSVVGVETRLVR